MRAHLFALTILFRLLNASTALAEQHWGPLQHVIGISQQSGFNGVWVIVDTTVANDNCPSAVGSYFLPDEGYSPPNPKYKSDFAIVMAAYLTGRYIDFYVAGCFNGNSPIIAALNTGQ